MILSMWLPGELGDGGSKGQRDHVQPLTNVGFKCQVLQSDEKEFSKVAMAINFLCLEDSTHLIRFRSSFSRPVTSGRSQS